MVGQDVRSWLKSLPNPNEGGDSDEWRKVETPAKTRRMVQLELECSTMMLNKPEISEESMEIEESQGLDIKKVERLAQAKEKKETRIMVKKRIRI